MYFQAWNDGVASVNDGDNGLKMLDGVVRNAEATGIKLILTLAKYAAPPSFTPR